MTNETQRYYIHGDRTDEDENSYYCAACDVFCNQAHFNDECHCKNHHARYLRTLNGLKEVLKTGSGLTRPQDSFNLFG